MKADVAAMNRGSPRSHMGLILRMLLQGRFRCVLMLRCAHYLNQRRGTRPFATVLANRMLSSFGAELAPGASIGPGLVLLHTTGIVVGNGVRAGEGLKISQGVTLGAKRAGGAQPSVGDNVQIGVGATVLGPVTIGDGARIGANSLVLDDVPAGRLVTGNAARLRTEEIHGAD